MEKDMISKVKFFYYLECLITNDGWSEVEARKRIGIARVTFNIMKWLLISKQPSYNNNMSKQVLHLL